MAVRVPQNVDLDLAVTAHECISDCRRSHDVEGRIAIGQPAPEQKPPTLSLEGPLTAPKAIGVGALSGRSPVAPLLEIPPQLPYRHRRNRAGKFVAHNSLERCFEHRQMRRQHDAQGPPLKRAKQVGVPLKERSQVVAVPGVDDENEYRTTTALNTDRQGIREQQLDATVSTRSDALVRKPFGRARRGRAEESDLVWDRGK